MELITVWEDGFGVWFIPYPMKPDQHPRHIYDKYRWQWSRSKKKCDLNYGEFRIMPLQEYKDLPEYPPIKRFPFSSKNNY